MADINFEIIKELGVISEMKRGITKGWSKELNIVSWEDADPKFDIRIWAPNHEKAGKGVTLTRNEAEELYELLGRALAK